MANNTFTAAVTQAQELTKEQGYDYRTWFMVLNRQAGTDPYLLRQAAAILSGLIESATRR